jgi:hypothetical protein
MISQIIELLKQRKQDYIVMVPTGVAAENVGGKTSYILIIKSKLIFLSLFSSCNLQIWSIKWAVNYLLNMTVINNYY